MIEFKGKQQTEPKNFLSEHIENELLTLNVGTSSFEDFLETKLQAKFDKSDQIFEQPEEELMDFMEQQNQQPKQT